MFENLQGPYRNPSFSRWEGQRHLPLYCHRRQPNTVTVRNTPKCWRICRSFRWILDMLTNQFLCRRQKSYTRRRQLRYYGNFYRSRIHEAYNNNSRRHQSHSSLHAYWPEDHNPKDGGNFRWRHRNTRSERSIQLHWSPRLTGSSPVRPLNAL